MSAAEGLKAAEDAAFGSPHPAAPNAGDDMVTPSKQLIFDGGASGETPVTPAMPASADAEEIDYDLFIRETLLWTNKIRSTFYFVVGLVLWYGIYSVFYSPITLPTGVAYLLLSSLFFNFLRAVMAPKYAERCRWSSSSWTRLAVSTSHASINAAAALHDRHLNGLDPLHTLEVAVALWLLSVLGRAFPAVSLLLALHLAAFSVPAAYLRFKPKIDATVSDVYGKVKAQYDALGRLPKASAILGLLVVLAVLLPTLDRLVALAIILVYGRAILKPTEYATVAKRVEAMASTFKTMGDKATNLAVSTINKYELTPTPVKAKKTQ